MGITQRRSRPLKRGDAARLRDDRLFLVACDDRYAPKQYFDFFRFARVHIRVIPTEDGTSHARHVLKRLLEFEFEDDDERWMVLDTDHCLQGSHLAGFIKVITEARRRGVKVALSKPSFEFWLLLHHMDEGDVGPLTDAAETEAVLREAIGEYNKTNLKRGHYPLASVVEACKRAERLDQSVAGGDVPEENTSRVYQLWKAIAAKALPSQLPAELQGLLPTHGEEE